MKDEVPQQMLDYTESMRKKILEYGFNVATLAFCKLFPYEVIQTDQIQVAYETVEHYINPVYTIRYKEKILCRRYQEDIFGLKFRFESPIFETEKQ